MIARGFKPVGWVAAVGTAALGCYMLSLRVASERADLTGLQRRIVATEQQIRSLQTELGTRGRLQQLEQWNDEVLALAAPVAAQYLHPDVRLARFGAVPAAPLETAEVRMASAAAPMPAPAPAAAPAAPAARHAVADQRSLAPPPPLERPIVQRTSLTLAAAAPARTEAAPPVRTVTPPVRTVTPPVRAVTPPVRTVTPPVRTAAAAPARTRTAAAEPARPARSPQGRAAALLDERTLREIGSAARAERGGGGTRD